MSWIKKIINWAVLYALIPLMIVELILVILITTNLINFNRILIPPYLKIGEAKLISDENGSPIYVNGWKSYFKTAYYDSNGFLIDDFPRLRNGKRNVLFLGDSYTEGLQVERHETFSSLIDQSYPLVNVINLGVGGTGTIAQMLRYKSVRSTPNVSDIVLFFLPQNDILNNHQKFHEQFGLPNAPYFSSNNASSNSEKNATNKSEIIEIIKNIAKNIITARIVYNEYLQNLNGPSSEEVDQKIDGSILTKDRLVWYNVYGEHSNLIWQEAWVYTERALLELKRLCTEDEVRLHFVIGTDSLQIFHYKNPLGEYDFNYPNNRLMKFCNNNALNCYNSLPYFLKYLDDNDLQYPYFSFENDGHYGPLGHKVMALQLQYLDLFK